MTRAEPMVLVVDDEVNLQRALRRRLERDGFCVVSAESGEEGLRLAEEQQPDVVLLDIMLPGMRGFDVCAQLKANPKTQHIPVILLSPPLPSPPHPNNT